MRFLTILLVSILLISGCGGGGNKQERPPETSEHPDKNPSWMGQKAGDAGDPAKNVDSNKQGILTEDSIEGLLASGEIPESMQSDVDSIRQHLTDSAQSVNDSIHRTREEEREKQRAEKRAKVEYINGVYADMWSDGRTILSYLSTNRTAVQVRAEAQSYSIKASIVREKMSKFDSSDPRRKVLESHAKLLELIAQRLPQTDGVKRKMDILAKDVTDILNKTSEQGDIVID